MARLPAQPGAHRDKGSRATTARERARGGEHAGGSRMDEAAQGPRIEHPRHARDTLNNISQPRPPGKTGRQRGGLPIGGDAYGS
jgi:hypothetical protein